MQGDRGVDGGHGLPGSGGQKGERGRPGRPGEKGPRGTVIVGVVIMRSTVLYSVHKSLCEWTKNLCCLKYLDDSVPTELADIIVVKNLKTTLFVGYMWWEEKLGNV